MLTSRRVDSSFEPERMDLIDERLHSPWELFLVDLRPTVGFSSCCMPAVVDPDKGMEIGEKRAVSGSSIELASDSSLPPASSFRLTERGRIPDRRDQTRPGYELQLR